MLSLIRTNPGCGTGKMNLGDEVNRMFRDYFGDMNSETRWLPLVDITEDNDMLVFTAELPGVSKEDVKISLNNNILIIEGEKKASKEYKDENAYRTERYYGKFSRSFTLSSEIDADKIRADFKDGVLTVNLPKSEKVKPHQITIN